MKAAFFFSKQDAKVGSKPALTSEDSMQLRERHLLRFSSLYSPFRFISSATAFSKNLDCIPVAPTEPISSLSTRIQHSVLSVCFMSSMARMDVKAHTLSS